MDDNKVVKFPKRRSQLVTERQKQVAKLLSFVTFVFALVFISHEMNNRRSAGMLVSEGWDITGQNSRGIANQSDFRDLKWEKELLSRLQNQIVRETASIGRSPNELTDLSLGQLAGNYRIVTQPDPSGRIFVKELEYVDGVESLSKPLSFESTPEFLNKNSYLFGLDQSSLKKSNESKDGESYQSRTWDGRPVGISLKKDSSGRLLRLSIQVQ